MMRHRPQIEALILDNPRSLTVVAGAAGAVVLARGGPLWGCPPEALIGRQLSSFGLGDWPGAPAVNDIEVTVRGVDGVERALSLSALPFTGEQGEPLVMLRLQDLEWARRAEAERASATLAHFVAGLAHELNNPVAIARSNADGLAACLADATEAWPVSAPLPEAFSELASIATDLRRSVERVSALVKALGELEHPVSPAPVELLELVRQVVEPHRGVEVHASGPITVHTDGALVRRSLERLVDNARRARPLGVVVRLTAQATGALLEVEDQGPGVQPELRGRIFDPFFTTRPPGEGVGLGLFLARRAAQRLGGALTLDSTFSPGARLRLLIPSASQAPRQAAPTYEDYRR